MFGYCGKLLYVNLTDGKLEDRELSEADAKKYMGGSALAARILFDMKAYAADPLGADNTIVFMTGPLTGTLMPGSGRFEVAARSPLTGGFGVSSAGGFFGAELKRAGYDGVVITGAAESPVYLWIKDGVAELLPADGLWGKTGTETMKAISEERGEKNCRTACIGPAGENLVRYACVIAGSHNFAGRTGLGAVMGAKKLKAVSVKGKAQVELAEKQEFMDVREKILKTLAEDVTAKSYSAYGTAGTMQLGMLVSDVPTKNWRVADWEEGSDKLNGISVAETILSGTKSCYACPIGCKRVVTIPDGPYARENAVGPEYETVASMGTMQLVDDIEAVTAANELCNELGMDTISAGSSIAFLRECFEAGLIGEEETGGRELKWGAAEQTLELLELAARREGPGSLLAEGVKRMSEKIGKGSEEFAVHSKGMEAPMHDPRAYHGLALAYSTSPRGACHITHADLVAEMGVYTYPEFGVTGGYDTISSKGKAEMVAGSENLGMVAGSAVMCMFVIWPLSMKREVLPALNAATGFGWSMADLVAIGERGWHLQRAFCNMAGMTAADDKVSPRALKPHLEGSPTGLDKVVATMTSFSPPSLPFVKTVANAAVGRIIPVQKNVVKGLGRLLFTKKLSAAEMKKKESPDLEYMLREYYTVRELDREGRARPRKLAELQLADVAETMFSKADASPAD
ncbi:MAG TPA: aldehyde ferredoxin oxidoreductase family protein [bacterium]|nr:aldehyde ferredoxin oxidoreductase family protein [bacterium]